MIHGGSEEAPVPGARRPPPESHEPPASARRLRAPAPIPHRARLPGAVRERCHSRLRHRAAPALAVRAGLEQRGPAERQQQLVWRAGHRGLRGLRPHHRRRGPADRAGPRHHAQRHRQPDQPGELPDRRRGRVRAHQPGGGPGRLQRAARAQHRAAPGHARLAERACELPAARPGQLRRQRRAGRGPAVPHRHFRQLHQPARRLRGRCHHRRLRHADHAGGRGAARRRERPGPRAGAHPHHQRLGQRRVGRRR